MIRPFTCVCMLMAGASGLYLYQEKHRAQMLDRDIARTVHDIKATRERTDLLRTEWDSLNDPARLQELAGRFLHLQPVAPSQYVQMADLDQRLPAPAPASGPASPDAPPAAESVPVAEAPAAPGQEATSAQAASTQPAALPRPPAPSTRLAAKPAAQPPKPLAVAAAHPVPHLVAAPAPHPAVASAPHEPGQAAPQIGLIATAMAHPAPRAAVPPARHEAAVVASALPALRPPAPVVSRVAAREMTPVSAEYPTMEARAPRPIPLVPMVQRVEAYAPAPRPAYPAYPAYRAYPAYAPAASGYGQPPVVASSLGAAGSYLAPPVPVGQGAR